MIKIPEEIINEEVLKYLEIQDWISLSLTSKQNNMMIRKKLKGYIEFLKDIYVDIAKLASYLKFHEAYHSYFSSREGQVEEGQGQGGEGQGQGEEGYDSGEEIIEERDEEVSKSLYKLFFDNGTRNLYRLGSSKSDIFLIGFSNGSRRYIFREDEIGIMLSFVVCSVQQNFENKEFKMYLNSTIHNIRSLNRHVYLEYLDPDFYLELCQTLCESILNKTRTKDWTLKLNYKHIYNRNLSVI